MQSGGALVLAQLLVSLGLLSPWLPHSSLPHPTFILETTSRGTPGGGTHGAGRESVRGISGADGTGGEWLEGQGTHPVRGGDMAPQGTCCSGGGQAGFQREPQAELNTPSTGPTDLTAERTAVPLPPQGAPHDLGSPGHLLGCSALPSDTRLTLEIFLLGFLHPEALLTCVMAPQGQRDSNQGLPLL